MNWIKRFFSKKEQPKQCDIHVVVGSKPTKLEVPSLNIDGSFVKADKFEQIWVTENVHNKYGASDSLRDSDYIDYHIWEDQNSSKMYKKHSLVQKILFQHYYRKLSISDIFTRYQLQDQVPTIPCVFLHFRSFGLRLGTKRHDCGHK